MNDDQIIHATANDLIQPKQTMNVKNGNIALDFSDVFIPKVSKKDKFPSAVTPRKYNELPNDPPQDDLNLQMQQEILKHDSDSSKIMAYAGELIRKHQQEKRRNDDLTVELNRLQNDVQRHMSSRRSLKEQLECQKQGTAEIENRLAAKEKAFQLERKKLLTEKKEIEKKYMQQVVYSSNISTMCIDIFNEHEHNRGTSSM